jgi:invasion protein IalB
MSILRWLELSSNCAVVKSLGVPNMPLDLGSVATRTWLTSLAFAAGLLLGWVGHRAINGAPDVPTITYYQGWRVSCPPLSQSVGSCTLQQDVLDGRTRSALAHLTLVQLAGDDVLVVTGPFNVSLPPGLALALDNKKPLVYRYEACGEMGCFAQVKFDDSLKDALLHATQGRVLVAALSGKPVGLPFSLKGFGDALAAYNRSEDRRNSWWWRLWS